MSPINPNAIPRKEANQKHIDILTPIMIRIIALPNAAEEAALLNPNPEPFIYSKEISLVTLKALEVKSSPVNIRKA
jgi:hypothetical protein